MNMIPSEQVLHEIAKAIDCPNEIDVYHPHFAISEMFARAIHLQLSNHQKDLKSVHAQHKKEHQKLKNEIRDLNAKTAKLHKQIEIMEKRAHCAKCDKPPASMGTVICEACYASDYARLEAAARRLRPGYDAEVEMVTEPPYGTVKEAKSETPTATAKKQQAKQTAPKKPTTAKKKRPQKNPPHPFLTEDDEHYLSEMFSRWFSEELLQKKKSDRTTG